MKRKIFIPILAGILTIGQVGVIADTAVETTADEIIASKAEILNANAFVQKSGTIKSIETDVYVAEDENGEEFWIEKSTLVTDGNGENYTLKADDKITLFVNADAPMVLSYPAKYSPDLVVAGEELPDVDIYNKSGENDFGDYTNVSNKLALNMSDNTKIVDKDGKEYSGDLSGKQLAVFYSIATMSIPAQTTPSKIIVLNTEEAKTEDGLFVNSKKIEFTECSSNSALLPLRAICEALDFNVEWDGALQSIRVGTAYTLQIGNNSYIKGKAMPLTLSSAPVLENGVTYVPSEYFTDVLDLKAEINGSSIQISSELNDVEEIVE